MTVLRVRHGSHNEFTRPQELQVAKHFVPGLCFHQTQTKLLQDLQRLDRPQFRECVHIRRAEQGSAQAHNHATFPFDLPFNSHHSHPQHPR
jgi:hypothetical protein